MAVYTSITLEDLQPVLEQYNIGEAQYLEPIAEGTANSNYLFVTTTGRYVCTLFEVPEEANQMGWLPEYLNHLQTNGINVGTIVPNEFGVYSSRLKGKVITFSRFVRGADVTPTADTAQQAGRALAKMHRHSENYPCPTAQTWAPEPLKAFVKTLDKTHPLFAVLIADDSWQTTNKAARLNLPQGVVHADYFPDNVLFESGYLSGVIDFYKAGLDAFAYDLAMALAAWGFDKEGNHKPKVFAAFLKGYTDERPLLAEEAAAMPILCRRACCVILAMRLGWLTKEREGTAPRPPEAFAKRLAFFQDENNTSKLGF